MTVLLPFLTFAGVLTFAASPPAGLPSTGPLRITGVVTSSRDGAPIPRCSLRLTPVNEDQDSSRNQDTFTESGAGERYGRPPGRRGGTQQADAEAVTDARGNFSIVVPRAGAWTLSGVARGFRQQRYQQHDQFSTALIVTSANPEVRVDLVLRPAASITGFVLDEFGEAVQSGQVAAQRRVPSSVAGAPVQWTSAGFASTDDRGHYELGSLADGEYRLAVSAHPWYATGVGNGLFTRRGLSPIPAASSPSDQSLDVVFPVTWFPGTQDERSADQVVLHAGEDRQADFHLQAVPAFHLDIPRPAESAAQAGNGLPGQGGLGGMPQVTRQTAGSPAFGGGAGQFSVNRDGSWQIGGLAPGTYQIRLPDGSPGQGRLIEITLTPGSSSTVNLENAVPTLRVGVEVEGAEPSDLYLLTFTNLESGLVFSDVSHGRGGPGRQGRTEETDGDANKRSARLPAGDYFVTAHFRPGLSLSGLTFSGSTADGATTTGRVIHLREGVPVLTLHVQHGSARVIGTATEAGKATPGAMVLLVPAAFGAPSNLQEIRRSQTASDGSFLFRNVPAGPYLLVSIANGWEVDWRDPGTLAKYLAQGTPLRVADSGEIQQSLQSVEP